LKDELPIKGDLCGDNNIKKQWPNKIFTEDWWRKWLAYK
jgi:hypothetical protein